MIIGFTGHRNLTCDPIYLDTILRQYGGDVLGGAGTLPPSTSGAVWIHGGAIGFDAQVAAFADAHNILQKVYRPDYARFGAKLAPIKRNQLIVESATLLVACYDGRTSGGTYQTIEYAERRGVHVILLPPLGHPHRAMQMPLLAP